MADETSVAQATTPPVVEREYNKRMMVSELFGTDDYEQVRQSVLEKGFFEHKGTGKKLFVHTRPVDGINPATDREVVALAAVARDPGLTQTYIDGIADYRNKTDSNRAQKIKQYWNIYRNNGIVNNAVNKYAAVLSVGGRYNVRKVRKGKQQKAMDTAQALLDFFNRNVNAPLADGIATPSRGLKALTEQGIRIALVEGDFMGRQVWGNHQVDTLGAFSLPMTIQTISMEFMGPVTGLAGLGDFWEWTPAQELKQLIADGGKNLNPLVKPVVKRLFDSDILKQIKKDGKAILDPALLCRVKHRSSDRDLYGESFIEPAKLGIRYLDAVNNTDMVSMESVINRLMIIMVGTDNPQSPYSKADVAAARAALMQSFFDDTGPAMTIVWQGNDVKVENVSAMNEMLDLGERHKIGERKIIMALGIPAALLDGTSSDGASAAWASLIAASGMAEHLGSAFARVWTEVGIRILVENGFTDIDVEYEYDRSNLVDKEQERNQNRNDYITGLLSIKSAIAATGRDPDAEFQQRCAERGLDPEVTTWEAAFLPPQGLQGQGAPGTSTPGDQMAAPGGPGGSAGGGGAAPPPGQGPGKTPGNGRTPNDQLGKPAKGPTAKTPSTTKK